jgi:hypothetical protein
MSVNGLALSHWFMILTLLHQLYAPAFVPSAYFAARGHYVAVSGSDSFLGARVYTFDGSSTKIIWTHAHVADVAIGASHLWAEVENSNKVCMYSLNGFTLTKCLSLDKSHFIRGMHFGNGALYLDTLDDNYSGPDLGKNAIAFNIYAIKESAPKLELVARDIGVTLDVQWCTGNDQEFTYWSNGAQHFSGARSFDVRASSFNGVTCATQNGHVAAIVDGRVYVDGKKGTEEVGGLHLYPFLSGWLCDRYDKFVVFSLDGASVIASGDKPTDLQLFRNDGALYLRANFPED